MVLASETSVKNARTKASQRGLEASLTYEDWIQTCEDMDYKCAYCCDKVTWDASLDHFRPLSRKGATTVTNCILCCTFCNQSKGNLPPETYLSSSPEQLNRIMSYLAHRRPGQSYQSFWTFPFAKKEGSMSQNTIERQVTPYQLVSGTELRVYNDENTVLLQFCRHPSETDPLVPGFQIASQLTAPECIALASTLLHYASSKVVEKEHPVFTGVLS